MLPSIPRLEEYDVSPVNGFLPSAPPLDVLPDPYYRPWENVIRNLQPLILTKRLRQVVDEVPVLSTDFLKTDHEWRRAYVILAFISHAYIWGGDIPCERVPPPISIPFTAACQRLELPLVATYAGVCLWNWRPLFPDEPVDTLENLSTLATFTGSLDESWFYLVSVAIESRGAPIIPLMLDAIEGARFGQTDVVADCLRSLAERLDELGALLNRMYESCDPHVFYHRIRPFLAGSKNMHEAGLPNGVIFDTNSPDDQYVQHSGGSNAQSSLIQFFDIVLGVQHRPQGHTTNSTSDTAPTHNFIHEMRTYMPGPHARFLNHVASIANIRQFVHDHRSNRDLVIAYDASLAMLRAFRDKHIQMVSRYIVVKSRESRSHSRSFSRSADDNNNNYHKITTSPAAPPVRSSRVNLATVGRRQSTTNKPARGTGGTALIPFLKQARNETGEPAIDAWARRLLSNGPGADADAVQMGTIEEHASGETVIVGLAGTWSVDDSDGGICHW